MGLWCSQALSCSSGDVIKLYAGGIVVSQGNCANSAYTLTPSSALSDGDHVMTVTATDGSNSESAHSDPLTVTIDTVWPEAPSKPDLVASSDTGQSNTDNITSDMTPTFTGTCDYGIPTVKIKLGSATVGQANCTAGDTYSISANGLTETTNNVTAYMTDIAGNDSEQSSQLSGLTIDRSVSAPVVNETGGTISLPTFSVSGTAEPLSFITISDGFSVLTVCMANASGAWGCTVPTPSTTGTHYIDFRTTDTAGNTSSATTRTYSVN